MAPFTIPLSSGHASRALQFSFSGLVSGIDRIIAQTYAKSIDNPPVANSATSNDALGVDSAARDRIATERSIVVEENVQREISRRFQDAAFSHLTRKLSLALSLPELMDVRGVVVSGGVASNTALRRRYVFYLSLATYS